MKVCLTLICLFLLALQDGETVRTFYSEEGGSVTVRREFDYYGKKRFLCKETCEGKNILIETIEDRDENGRFSIRYERRSFTESDFLHVSITDLKPSDSGRYRCRLEDTWRGIQDYDFYLVVTKDPPEPKWTRKPFIGSTFLPTSTQSFSPSPPETIKLSEKPAAASDRLLYVVLVLVLVVLIVSLAAALLIFIRRKKKGFPEETEYVNFSKAEDDAVEYSEVQFLKDASPSAHSAPCGHAENVTYSEIQMNSANLSDDSALYSNISLQQ